MSDPRDHRDGVSNAADESDPPEHGRADYEVGYGKPPRSSQFKKGQSGNRKGRPKGQKNLATLLRKYAEEAITIREGEKSRTMSKLEAVMVSLVHRAIRGNDRAAGKLFELLKSAGLLKAEESGDATSGVLRVDRPCLTTEEWIARFSPDEGLNTIEKIDSYQRGVIEECKRLRECVRKQEAWYDTLRARNYPGTLPPKALRSRGPNSDCPS
jgi:hypothetical protein